MTILVCCFSLLHVWYPTFQHVQPFRWWTVVDINRFINWSFQYGWFAMTGYLTLAMGMFTVSPVDSWWHPASVLYRSMILNHYQPLLTITKHMNQPLLAIYHRPLQTIHWGTWYFCFRTTCICEASFFHTGDAGQWADGRTLTRGNQLVFPMVNQ